jgi:hypothetical protein
LSIQTIRTLLGPALLAAAALLLAVAPARAAVHYLDLTGLAWEDRTSYGIVQSDISGVSGPTRLYFDPLAATPETALSTSSFGYSASFGVGGFMAFMGVFDAEAFQGGNSQWTSQNGLDPYTVAAGSTVGPGTTFTIYEIDSSAGIDFTAGLSFGIPAYFGFAITNGADTNYGWANITVNNSPDGGDATVTYNAIAYEQTPNQSITVAPEPSVTALLAASGAWAFVFCRKRRDFNHREHRGHGERDFNANHR